MSTYEKLASAILPPMEGSINAVAITTSASAVQDTGITSDNAPRYVTLISDAAFYVTFGNNGTNVVTDPDGSAVAGAGRTWLVPASTPANFLVGKTQRYFKVRGVSASGTLRWYASSR